MSCKLPQKTHLGGHDQLMIHYVVWGVAHSEEGAGGVQMARHPCPDVHILPNTLRKRHNRRPHQENTAHLGSCPVSSYCLDTCLWGKPRSTELHSEKEGTLLLFKHQARKGPQLPQAYLELGCLMEIGSTDTLSDDVPVSAT